MKQKTYRGEWAGCSDLTERRQELSKAHEEFEKLLANGFKVKDAKVKTKRPRISKPQNPKQVVVTLGGNWSLRLSFEDYQKHGEGLKVTMRIY